MINPYLFSNDYKSKSTGDVNLQCQPYLISTFDRTQPSKGCTSSVIYGWNTHVENLFFFFHCYETLNMTYINLFHHLES